MILEEVAMVLTSVERSGVRWRGVRIDTSCYANSFITMIRLVNDGQGEQDERKQMGGEDARASTSI